VYTVGNGFISLIYLKELFYKAVRKVVRNLLHTNSLFIVKYGTLFVPVKGASYLKQPVKNNKINNTNKRQKLIMPGTLRAPSTQLSTLK
jgi:hypothetical protein